MPISVPPPAEAIVARLRAAGCVFAEDEARVLAEAATTVAELERMVARRVAGTPLELVVGWAEFCGLRIVVEPGVFVPRRRSEFLVDVATARLRPGAVVVDLCCGSGAIGAALASRMAEVELHAADVDPVAVSCARGNVVAYGGEVHVGDLYDALPGRLRGRVDVLVANAPYVPTDELPLMPAEARLHEPQVALDGGGDGLDVVRRVALGAAEWLAAGSGVVLVETSRRQAPAAAGVFASNGLAPTVVGSEELNATVVVGELR
jgi:release factor glutamine methyltransferase